jgi:hypothetical protein
MRAGLSFSRSPISLLLRQPLSIKKSYAGAIQAKYFLVSPDHCCAWLVYDEAHAECRFCSVQILTASLLSYDKRPYYSGTK